MVAESAGQPGVYTLARSKEEIFHAVNESGVTAPGSRHSVTATAGGVSLVERCQMRPGPLLYKIPMLESGSRVVVDVQVAVVISWSPARPHNLSCELGSFCQAGHRLCWAGCTSAFTCSRPQSVPPLSRLV
ncbi:hypothetical protein NDU88_004963 [Pleurodeles waltl]|uniref:Uncharacterized protein n=1 Tax=Pleurodeles waltl TaxID=8319 RepID=A0AAV7TUA1_PLEWA|nr:hypothetical protein NDU88_004963 [Pleurodeles waltl]